MHAAAYAWIEQWRGPQPAATLDFGGRDVNGSVRHLFAGIYLVVDPAGGDGVDVVASAADVDLGHGRWNTVVCAEVLEHVDDVTAAGIVANAHRHLVAGGRLVLTCAGPGRLPHSAVDGGPLRTGEHYRNVDAAQLQNWLTAAGFREALVDVHGHDTRCVAWA